MTIPLLPPGSAALASVVPMAADARRLALAALLRLVEPPAPAVMVHVATVGAEQALDDVVAGRAPVGVAREVVARLSVGSAGAIRERAWADLEAAGRVGARLIGPGDAEWPGDAVAGLDFVPSVAGYAPARPIALYVRGQPLPVAVGGTVAMVGSRAATPYGLRVATEFGHELTGAGFRVVSGGAFGIDAAGHRGALTAGGGTIAVLACGIDRCYPQAHRGLLEHIGEVGTLVSEYPPGGNPARYRFLIRNRLIAALAVGTVVVEAGRRSGALNTARTAEALSRLVMAVPGPVTSALSVGCHELLQDGTRLVTRAADVVALLGPLHVDPDATDEGAAGPLDRLDPATARVFEALPARGARSVAELVQESGVPAGDVLRGLARLDLEGLARRDNGRWRRIRPPAPS